VFTAQKVLGNVLVGQAAPPIAAGNRNAASLTKENMDILNSSDRHDLKKPRGIEMTTADFSPYAREYGTS
jgi:hypothetical protein